MAQAKNLLFPRTIEEQVIDLNTKRKYLKKHAERFGISPAEIATIDTQVDAAIAAYDATTNPAIRTRMNTEIRKEAIHTAQITLRTVINYYVLHNPDATSADFTMLSIHRKNRQQRRETPADIPGIGHISSRDMTLTIPFFDTQTGRHGKPEGVMAIEAVYRIGDTPPADPSTIAERQIETASPMHLQFRFEDLQHRVHLAFRWVGLHGGYGPWTEIITTSITR
jgi:hypothetical protein